MATESLWRGDKLRWMFGIAIVVASVAGVTAHIVDQHRNTDAISAVLGADPAELGRRLFEARTGLGVRLYDAERSALNARIGQYPLDGNAFALAGLDATARGDDTKAAKLITHALALEPRTRLAWLWRLDDHTRAHRNVEAANDVLRLLAVDSAQYPVYVPMLAALSNDRRNIPQIAIALRGNPTWRVPFLGLLETGGFDPSIRYALMDGGAAKILTANTEQTSFVSDLIAKGDYERAYLAWISYLPDTALNGVDTPYDAKFAGLPGAAPFNWQLTAESGDRAETGDGGLDISYSGRKAATLANQVVVLQPGAYRLRSVVAGGGSEGGPGPSGGTTLAWQAQCLPGNRVIGTLSLDIGSVGKPQTSPAFQVSDSGCSAVALVLVGAASEFPTRLNAKIAMVRLEKVADADVAAAPVLPAGSAAPSPHPSVLP